METEIKTNIVNKKFKWIVLAIILAVIVAVPALSFWYTNATLSWARSQGVYPTPVEGAITRVNRWFCDVERVDIDHASTNSFDGSNPHVWYVIWTVYAKSHPPCDPENPGPPLYHRTYERGGGYYLNVKDGWVMMPEGRFPEFIGFWMKVFHLAGPGDPTHISRD